MKNLFRLSLAIMALLGLLAAGSVRADPPARPSGKVLVLDNQRTLEGDIQRQGDYYIIRRGVGEMTLPASQVQRMCANWDEAFAFMQSQANLHDPDEHLRLAKWCEMNGLRERALAEADRAVQMQPGNPAAKQFLTALQKATPSAPPPGTQQAKNNPDLAAPPIIDLSAECLALFHTRIQPILMNTCATCHAGGKGGEFKLMRCEDATVNRRATQFNLAAVVAQINFERPEVSPLLYKSFSKHGSMAQAPLQGRESAPYQTLLAWVQMTVTNNPHLRKDPPAKLAITAPPAVGTVTPSHQGVVSQPQAQPGNNQFTATGGNPGVVPTVPVLTPGVPLSNSPPAPSVFAASQQPAPISPDVSGIRQVQHEVQNPPVVGLGQTGACDPDGFNRLEHPKR